LQWAEDARAAVEMAGLIAVVGCADPLITDRAGVIGAAAEKG
jgi:hypothetical protein